MRGFLRSVAIFTAVASLALTYGCGGPSAPAQHVSASPSASTAPTSVSPSPAVNDDCLNSGTRDIVSGMAPVWATLVDSRGQSGHGALVKDFAGLVDQLAKKLKGLCADEHDDVVAAAAGWNFDMTLLNFVSIGVPQKASTYQKAADDGNKLAKAMGVEGIFKSPEQDTPTEPPTPAGFHPHKSDFSIKLKILKKQCFGSAGCNITYRIKPTYVGSQTLPDEGTIEVTYKVTGGDSGPNENTFTVEGGQVSYDKEEFLSTSSIGRKLKVKVVDVSYSS